MSIMSPHRNPAHLIMGNLTTLTMGDPHLMDFRRRVARDETVPT